MSVLTVSQLNKYIAFKINSDIKLKSVMVEGEISNFVNHYKSGHLYFTLKDKSTCVKAIMFAKSAARLKFTPFDGMKVIICGNVEVFERDGVYQIYVSDMQPSGVGGLYLAVEQVKKKLSSQGIFDDKYKKQIPKFPKKIGIITSTSGAALHDILNVLSRRYPLCEAHIFPAIVQGEQAVNSLCSQLKSADESYNDVIIIGRGGGSLEDLMAFNSEILAKQIYNCNTPVISGVGHETDTTICDFVSDLRAPTPSAAAELAVPEIESIYNYLIEIENKLKNIINTKTQKYDDQLQSVDMKLKNMSPNARIENALLNINNINDRLNRSYNTIINIKENNLNEKISVLSTLNPLAVLSRGYSLSYKGDKLLKSAKDINVGDEIKIQFSDSGCLATVTKKEGV